MEPPLDVVADGDDRGDPEPEPCSSRGPAAGSASSSVHPLRQPPLKLPNQYRKKRPHGILRLNMACINQDQTKNHLNSLREHDLSSDSDSGTSEGRGADGTLHTPAYQDVNPGIDINTIKSAKKIEHIVAHRVQAGRSILALVVDDDYLFAGLEGGDIAVSNSSCVPLLINTRVPQTRPEPISNDCL